MNETHTQSNLQPVRLPILKMAGLSVLACVMIGIGGGSVANIRGEVMTDGLWTIAAMLPAVLLTLMGLNLLPSRAAGMWAVPVLAGTMIRAGMVAVLGFVVFLIVEPTKNVFLLTLLMSLLTVLVIDVMSVLSLIKSVEESSMERHAPVPTPEVQA